MTQLRASPKHGQVHSFIPGRSYGWSARDDLAAGHQAMPNKVSRFLCHTADVDVLAELNRAEGPTVEEEMDSEGSDEVPLPVMVNGGQLVTGDTQDDDWDMPPVPDEERDEEE